MTEQDVGFVSRAVCVRGLRELKRMTPGRQVCVICLGLHRADLDALGRSQKTLRRPAAV